MASDLRVVLSSIRLSAIYERMGDESVTIAKRANKLNKRPRLREAGLVEPVYRELAEQFRAVNKAVSSWDAPASPAPGLASLAEKTGTLTETFARLPEHYRDNLASVADLIFIGRSLERVAEGLQKVAAEALYGVGPRQS